MTRSLILFASAALLAFVSCNKDDSHHSSPQRLVSPDAVDMGLSVKWASCNVGASKPEEHGNCYQWAGSQDVTNTGIYLDWNNSPYHTGDYEETGWTKYIPSNKSSYWSGSGNPDNKTGIAGMIATSHHTGNSIFFPVTGIRYSDRWDFKPSYGFYWTSSLSTDCPSYAYYTFVDYDCVNWLNYTERYNGCFVRPVSD